jgi:hypothetical protein
MKKWAIHTLFMSIILGFCQKIHTFSLPTSIGGFWGPGTGHFWQVCCLAQGVPVSGTLLAIFIVWHKVSRFFKSEEGEPLPNFLFGGGSRFA